MNRSKRLTFLQRNFSTCVRSRPSTNATASVNKGLKLALFGVARSGKDTVAEYLQSTHKFELCAFSTHLKETLRKMFNLSTDQLYGHLKDVVDTRYSATPRQFMTWLGNDAMLNDKNCPLPYDIRSTFWIRQLFLNDNLSVLSRNNNKLQVQNNENKNIYSTLLPTNSATNVCITDGRRIEEFRECLLNKFVPVLVVRPFTIKNQKARTSESFVFDQSCAFIRGDKDCAFKHVVLNNSTVVELHKQINKIISSQ